VTLIKNVKNVYYIYTTPPHHTYTTTFPRPASEIE